MLAIAVINHFSEDISENHIRTGLKNAVWPGRFQVLSHDPYIIYDVAHNEDGIRTLLKTVKKIFKKRPIGLCALKEDKDLELIANAIQGHFEKLYVLDDEKELLMDSKVLSSNLNKQGVKAVPLKQIKDFAPCLYDDHPGIIFGSHYIAEPIFKHFQFSFDSGTI
jgi:dihydrofolate synthase/folylpolyglutamate synthase